MSEGGQQVLELVGGGHLLGQLEAMVAKQVLPGWEVVLVGCEGINISGSFYRNKLKYLAFLPKQVNTSLSRGPDHFRAPSASSGGKADGVSWCPQGGAFEAYAEVCLTGAPGAEGGCWYQEVTATVEENRKEKAKIHPWKKKQLLRLRKQAEKNRED
uniref:Uncharacterized protein n=1 Tax=Catagonus wagneri TaxID=51154 RepID=A0A8C3WMB5_9CETA